AAGPVWPAARLAALAAVLVCLCGPDRALAAPTVVIESARFGNTFVVGEAPALTVRVLAEAEQPVRGTLRIVARDGYGAAAGRSRTIVDLAAGATASVPFTIASRRIGHFTVDITLRTKRPAEMVRATATAGIVPAVAASSASDSAVGYYILPF